MTLNMFQNVFMLAEVFIDIHVLVPPLCWWPFGGCSHLCWCSLFLNKNLKSDASTRGVTWSSHFFSIFLLSTLLMFSSCLCLHGEIPIIAFTQSLKWDIRKSKMRIHVSFKLFKLMQVCTSDQSGLCILPHKSQGLPLRIKHSQYYRNS